MNNRVFTLTVSEDLAGERLDNACARLLEAAGESLTRSALKNQALQVQLNSRPEKWSAITAAGQTITLTLPPIRSSELVPRDQDFEILYSDNDIAVINKPAGLTVHPAKGHEDDTLVHGLLYRLEGKLSSIGGVERPGIVHRLDKDTSGLLLIALNDHAHHKLTEAFQTRAIEKIYHAVVKGHPPETGMIDLPIGRSERDRKKMAVKKTGGKPSLTEYRVLEYLKDHAWVEIRLHSGRTHQIRVHFSHLGYPVAGDPLYSRHANHYDLKGIALCARKIVFSHPVTGQAMSFEINLPQDMSSLIGRLKIR